MNAMNHPTVEQIQQALNRLMGLLDNPLSQDTDALLGYSAEKVSRILADIEVVMQAGLAPRRLTDNQMMALFIPQAKAGQLVDGTDIQASLHEFAQTLRDLHAPQKAEPEADLPRIFRSKAAPSLAVDAEDLDIETPADRAHYRTDIRRKVAERDAKRAGKAARKASRGKAVRDAVSAVRHKAYMKVPAKTRAALYDARNSAALALRGAAENMADKARGLKDALLETTAEQIAKRDHNYDAAMAAVLGANRPAQRIEPTLSPLPPAPETAAPAIEAPAAEAPAIEAVPEAQTPAAPVQSAPVAEAVAAPQPMSVEDKLHALADAVAHTNTYLDDLVAKRLNGPVSAVQNQLYLTQHALVNQIGTSAKGIPAMFMPSVEAAVAGLDDKFAKAEKTLKAMALAEAALAAAHATQSGTLAKRDARLDQAEELKAEFRDVAIVIASLGHDIASNTGTHRDAHMQALKGKRQSLLAQLGRIEGKLDGLHADLLGLNAAIGGFEASMAHAVTAYAEAFGIDEADVPGAAPAAEAVPEQAPAEAPEQAPAAQTVQSSAQPAQGYHVGNAAPVSTPSDALATSASTPHQPRAKAVDAEQLSNIMESIAQAQQDMEAAKAHLIDRTFKTREVFRPHEAMGELEDKMQSILAKFENLGREDAPAREASSGSKVVFMQGRAAQAATGGTRVLYNRDEEDGPDRGSSI